jgi:hypothetical protein
MSAAKRQFVGVLLAAALAWIGASAARAAETDTMEDMAAMTANIGRTPFAIQGFGNVDLLANSPDSSHSGLSNGALDLFVTSRLDDHWSALIELVFEPDGNEIVNDLERFEFMYEYSDAFRISAGRVHNPFLRWPITFHHGLLMQTPVERPIMARWEDEPGLWPMHFVGLLAQGRLLDGVGLSYAIGAGNGRGTTLSTVQVGHDANDDKAVVGSLGLSPEALRGFEAHVSVYGEQIPADTTWRERDIGYAASYARGDIEIRGEWSQMDHRNVAFGVKYLTTGWYALAGYRIAVGNTHVKPFVMVEKLEAAHGESYLGNPQDEKAWAAGLRWDVTRYVAIKGQLRQSTLGTAAMENAVRMQLAVNF